MFSLNRVHIIGYQTQPVNVRKTPGGTSVTDLNIVVPYAFKSEKGEELKGKSFHVVTVWGAMAEFAGQFLKVGSQLFVAGRLQTDTWEDAQSHEKRSKTKLVAMDMIFLDPKSGQMETPHGAGNILTCLNRADLIGHVTKDPEMRTTTSGQQVLTLGVATNDRWTDKAGQKQERSEFHNVVIWGGLAESVGRHIKKGNRVFVSGRVQTRSWETQAGAKRYTTEIVAESVSLLGVKSAVAEEAFRADAGFNQDTRKESMDQSAPEPEPVGVASGIPAIEYGSEIKVEDLPF
jgi:single-strand DNA-binding protein